MEVFNDDNVADSLSLFSICRSSFRQHNRIICKFVLPQSSRKLQFISRVCTIFCANEINFNFPSRYNAAEAVESRDYHNNFHCDNFHFVKLVMEQRRGDGRQARLDDFGWSFLHRDCWTRQGHETKCDTFPLSKLRVVEEEENFQPRQHENSHFLPFS